MECYDISTFQGALAVGSGVSMRDGEPDKANYRRYKVKGVAGQDDFAMLYEVDLAAAQARARRRGSSRTCSSSTAARGSSTRRSPPRRTSASRRSRRPATSGAPFVELVGLAKSRLVDGPRRSGRRGRRAARRAAERAPSGAAALADAAEAAERGFVSELARSPERVFLPGRKDPVVLRQNSAELFLLARLRDEAHRFAITFHRKLRRERNFQSVLEEIPGIGEGRKKALLRHFGSLRG